MTDSIDTSEREAEEPRLIDLPVREMREEPVPHQEPDLLRAALQLALEATPEELPAALDALRELLSVGAPVAARYDFDGHGWLYIDAGSGSDWRTRHAGAELLCVVTKATPRIPNRATLRIPNKFTRKAGAA